MKEVRSLFIGALFGGIFIFGLHLLHAQELAMPVQLAAPDSIVQLTADAQGLTLLSPGQAPRFGTFWLALPGGILAPAPCPPLDPGVPIYFMADQQYLADETGGQVTLNNRLAASSTVEGALEAQASSVLNLITRVQTTAAGAQVMMGGRTSMAVPSFDDTGSGSGSADGFYSDSFNFIPNYGTNLWLAITNVTPGTAWLFVSNTVADIQYEIQYKTDLAQSDWQSANWFMYGSEITNWTPTSILRNSSTNLFLRVRSWQDDGSGLPLWWQEKYFGTNGVDPYGDPAGDGWNNLQKFQNGMNPNVFYTPPAPQGVVVNYNSFNSTAAITWLPSPGPVTGYTVEKTDSFAGTAQDFSVSASARNYPDNVSSAQPDYLNGGALDVSYKVQAHYAGGSSSWSDSMPLEPNTISASIIGGSSGSAYVTTTPLPSGTTTLRVMLIDPWAWFAYYYLG